MDLFGTAGIRGSAEERVTPELALRVGRAAGQDGSEFVVGRDGRETGPALAAAVEAGLESAGAAVRRVGVVPTPTLAFASRGRYGVQLTASHNPPEDNGIKLFEDGVEYGRGAEGRIEELVDHPPDPAPWDTWGDVESISVIEEYIETVVAYARNKRVAPSHPSASVDELDPQEPLSELRAAVDCGNGMGSLATPHILDQLGASVVTLNASVDGHFPGRPSKPTPETLATFREFVADGSFALGIAHDGDADRVVFLDGDGEVVHEDTIVAILAEQYGRTRDVSEPVVVTTPNASGRIDERVSAAGGRVERTRLGALHEGIERVREDGGDVVFAAEPWKHIHPEHGGWIDGVASAAVLSVLMASAGGLAPLREPVTERPYRKASVACPDEKKSAAMASVKQSLPDAYPEATVSTEYGVRLDFDDGSWILVRPSGTEPYIRIYVESESVDTVLEAVRELVTNAVPEQRE
ncbi:MAG: phosphopentomutase/phosphoglucosamine mutase [Halodesulfurarchaeum sp.]